MTISHRPAKFSDYRGVLSELAPRMSEEYHLAGINQDQISKFFREWIKAGTADVIVQNEEKIAIFAWAKDDNCIQTSFAAKEKYFHPSTFRHLYRYLRELQDRLGGLDFVSNSYSKHPDTLRWFQKLGFELETQQGYHRVLRLRAS